MIPARTSDLRYARWLDGIVPSGFETYRKIVHDGDGLSSEALAELIDILRRITPAGLQQEVTYGLWEGHPGIFGGAVVPERYPSGGGLFTRALATSAQIGASMAAARQRRRADTGAWLDDQIYRRLELSGHRYLLFRGRLEAVTQWSRDTSPLIFRHSPDLIWPDNHSWMVAAPPEQGFTVVAGNRLLADELDGDNRLNIV